MNNPDGDIVPPVIGSLNDYLAGEAKLGGRLPNTVPETPIQESFQQALDAIRRHPNRPPDVYDDLLQANFPR